MKGNSSTSTGGELAVLVDASVTGGGLGRRAAPKRTTRPRSVSTAHGSGRGAQRRAARLSRGGLSPRRIMGRGGCRP
eukprot:7344550-Prymnesium_polylepis.1